jgi:hypothetical protein
MQIPASGPWDIFDCASASRRFQQPVEFCSRQGPTMVTSLMTERNADGRQDGDLNPQALRPEDMARILSAPGQRKVAVATIEADVADGASLDGRQRKHRKGRRRQRDAVEE